MKTQPLWGIDLGGTKIEGVVLPSQDTITPICRLRISTEADQGYDHLVQRIQTMLEMLEEASGEKCPAIGVGTPGRVDPKTHLMMNCNTTALNGKPLETDLTTALGLPVMIANDANCFALAEANLGAARGASTVFGVIMGTGVGGGIVIDGKCLPGVQGIAGEWGHNVLERDGEPCYCGKRGCVETVLSGPALERRYLRRTGVQLPLSEIAVRARSGDSESQETISHLISKFGEALSVVVNILDPEVVVLGGGVGNVDELYTQGLDSLYEWIFSPSPETKLVRPSLGDSAGVFGAAHLTSYL
jgi:fructokinase